VKLYNLEWYGRGEKHRLLLTHAKVKFEDIKLSEKEFEELLDKDVLREKFEFGQIPVVEIDGEHYA
jgi:hypothetical protein